MALTTDRFFSVDGTDLTSHLISASFGEVAATFRNSKQGIGNHTSKRGKVGYAGVVRLEQQEGVGSVDETIQAWADAGVANIVIRSRTGGNTFTGDMTFSDYENFIAGVGDEDDEFELNLEAAGPIVKS